MYIHGVARVFNKIYEKYVFVHTRRQRCIKSKKVIRTFIQLRTTPRQSVTRLTDLYIF